MEELTYYYLMQRRIRLGMGMRIWYESDMGYVPDREDVINRLVGKGYNGQELILKTTLELLEGYWIIGQSWYVSP